MLRLSLIVRALICFSCVFLPLHNLDRWFYDHLFRLRGSQYKSTNIILININETKLISQLQNQQIELRPENQAFSPKTHTLWNKAFYENLLKIIADQKPKLIVFTTFFNWSTDTKPLNSALKNNIVFSSAINEYNKLIPPLPSIIRNVDYGFCNIIPDSDNVVRSININQNGTSSLSLITYYRITGKWIKDNLNLFINYRGHKGSYPTLDAWELLEESPPANIFKDKIIFIGKESNPENDFNTPLGKMSANEIQANIVETLLYNKGITVLPRWISWLLATIVVAISLFIILYLHLSIAWLFLLFFAMALILLDLLMFASLGIWLGIGNSIFCIFSTHILLLGYTLSRHEELQWKFEQETKTLREIDEFKNNFISLFSHDLKTPIARIKASIDTIKVSGAEINSEILNSIKSIETSNNELAKLISDILKVTKMEIMHPELKKESVDINTIIETSVERLSFKLKEKNLDVIFELEPLFPIEADPNLLAEILHNILDNAIKFSNPNEKIIIKSMEENSLIKVIVIDRGMGIPNEELPHVTGKFYRGKKSFSSTTGSGLGLYLAKYFIELHGGTISIESKEKMGTSVSFTLPIKG